MFELFVNLSNMYWLMCDIQSQKLRKLDKILSNLSVEERNMLMEKLQRDKSGIDSNRRERHYKKKKNMEDANDDELVIC